VVIDSKEGTVVGTMDLGGVPEQAATDGKGHLWVVMQDAQGSVTAVDAKAMKATAHYPFGDKGGCNGLALDEKNHVLFAACARSGDPDVLPPRPMMVVMNADDGRILTTLPLAGGSDGAVFNPATMEAFSSHGNGTMTVVKEKSPTTFEVEQNLQTMNGARTLTFDSKTGHVLTMSVERAGAGAASRRRPRLVRRAAAVHWAPAFDVDHHLVDASAGRQAAAGRTGAGRDAYAAADADTFGPVLALAHQSGHFEHLAFVGLDLFHQLLRAVHANVRALGDVEAAR
jgi:hypothetical protein